MKDTKGFWLAVVLVLSLPLQALAIEVQTFNVNTTVGFGTVWINGVPDHDSLAVGTLLSGELAQLIEADPGLGDPRLSQLEETFGTLTNLEFLTAPLTQFGNAGDQIKDDFTAFFDAQNSTVGGTATLTISNVFFFQEQYSLLGGPLNENTIVVGTADVSFYEVTAHITLPTDSMQPIPEPGTLLLFGTGLAGVLFMRRKNAYRRK